MSLPALAQERFATSPRPESEPFGSRFRARTRWIATAVLLAVLALLHTRSYPNPTLQSASDTLQLSLAIFATAACGLAAARASDLAKALWASFGASTGLWALGQAIWTLHQAGSNVSNVLSPWDLLFLTSAAPLVVATLFRPDRPMRSAREVAFDVSLVLAVLAYVYVYFALGYIFAIDTAGYSAWTATINWVRGPIALWVWWRMRGARQPWRALYGELTAALVLWQAGDLVVTRLFFAGSYHAGLYDIPWTIPLLWIGMTAWSWQASEFPISTGSVAPDWKEAKLGTAIAVSVLALVPLLHLLVSVGSDATGELQAARESLTVIATLIAGALLIGRQLSILRQVEADQRRREASVRLIFKSNPHAMFVLDPATWHFLDANDMAVAQFGRNRDELHTLRFVDIHPPEDHPRIEAFLAGAAAAGPSFAPGSRQSTKDGASYDVDLAGQTIEFEGRPALLVVASDVTERNRAQHEAIRLEASLRLSEKMSAMGAITAGVAHEVRNPLFGITATVDAFEARFGTRAEYSRFTETLRHETDRLNQLMKDLLDYGRPSSDTLQPGPLPPVLAEAVRACSPLAQQTEVELSLQIDPDLPLIKREPDRLCAVFQNVIENAVQHSRARDVVRVAARRRTIDGAAWVECTVLDSGPGFVAADLPRVLEPFYTQRRGGTGLGLSIAQRIVEEHGGTIRCANRPERGAQVTVSLPGAAA